MRAPRPSDASGLSSSGILAKSAETSDTRFSPSLSYHGSTPDSHGYDLLLPVLLALAVGFLFFPADVVSPRLASSLAAVSLFSGLVILPADDPQVNLRLRQLHFQIFYFTIPHFDGYSAVLVRLHQMVAVALQPVVEDAWLARAPRQLVAD